VLAEAARDPDALAIGIDADARSMERASRRAARPARKGGARNALFVVAAAGNLPTELGGLGSLVTVRLPWGSLLRGCLGADPPVAAGVAGLVRPGGTLELLLAPAERDGLGATPAEAAAVVEAARAAFEGCGLRFLAAGPATAGDLARSGSTWAKRLIPRSAREGHVVRDGRPARGGRPVGDPPPANDRRPLLLRFRSP
jgi:16S rRNA (adenine(1408)-N(1))-methyltransferase